MNDSSTLLILTTPACASQALISLLGQRLRQRKLFDESARVTSRQLDKLIQSRRGGQDYPRLLAAALTAEQLQQLYAAGYIFDCVLISSDPAERLLRAYCQLEQQARDAGKPWKHPDFITWAEESRQLAGWASAESTDGAEQRPAPALDRLLGLLRGNGRLAVLPAAQLPALVARLNGHPAQPEAELLGRERRQRARQIIDALPEGWRRRLRQRHALEHALHRRYSELSTELGADDALQLLQPRLTSQRVGRGAAADAEQPSAVDRLHQHLLGLRNGDDYQRLLDELQGAAETLRQQPEALVKLSGIALRAGQGELAEVCAIRAWQQSGRARNSTQQTLLLCAMRDGRLAPEPAAGLRAQLLVRQAMVCAPLRLLYSPIPKNASTSFKLALIQACGQGQALASAGAGVHAFASHRDNGFVQRDASLWGQAGWTRLIVLRDPFGRLLSAYLNKVASAVPMLPYVESAIALWQARQALDVQPARGLSFAEFVDMVCQQPDLQANSHWRPQSSWFIDSVADYELSGALEQLTPLLERLQQQYGLQVQKESGNRTRYQRRAADAVGSYAQVRPQRLAAMKAFPGAELFYTPELVQRVAERFAIDVGCYRQAFGVDPQTRILERLKRAG